MSRPDWAAFDVNVYMIYDPFRVFGGGILLKLYQVILSMTAVGRLEVCKKKRNASSDQRREARKQDISKTCAWGESLIMPNNK